MPKVRRMFVHEYGVQAYMRWHKTLKGSERISLRAYEQQLRKELKLPPGSPVVDEWENR